MQSQSPSALEEKYDRPRPPPSEAPWYQIQDRKLLAVEHPAVILNNTDRAVRMLGGGKAVAQAFKPNPENISEPNGLELRFRPGDALAPPIQGKPARTRAMLLKITVPKGKGPNPRPAPGQEQDIPGILKGLDGKFTSEVVGWVDHTIRFRDMADYQWNTRNSEWAKNVEENMMELDLQALKRLQLSDKITADADAEIMRPPRFTHINYPFVYGFRQNPAIKVDTDVNGEPVFINAGARVQTQTQYGNWNSDTVPQSGMRKRPKGPPLFVDCLKKLEELFEERPIWTRRGLMNNMPSSLWQQLKWAYPHVAYYWRSGPWRDTYVKFGVDPRKSKEFAKYQVVAFKVHTVKPKKDSSQNTGHLFDGETIILDGKIWQFCDLKDPLLAELADIEKCEARDVCDNIDGWFPNNRHFKIKYIMRRKLSALIAGRRMDDRVFQAILKEPDSAAPGTLPPRKQVMYTASPGEREEDGATGGGNNDKIDIVESEEDDADLEEDEEVGELVDEFGEEFESEGEEDDDTSEGDESESQGGKRERKETAARDERLQKLMERFMQGHQQEGVSRRTGHDDGFELLGESD
ncbi:tau 95 subunit of transcription factor TFIIIC [Arthrobotrys musiformis]|uniref:Tau 95 subunit of transcription factor TFIIIC n=1 Tax=Arthrobotrys musiformis TaxID=47236 RepID=A0AAV9VY92_9PEZI